MNRNLEIAISIASALSEKELIDIYKITKTKYTKICASKHKGGSTLKRRDTTKETEAGRIKKMLNILNTAKDIKTNGNLLLTDSEDVAQAKVYVSKIMSDFFNRPFMVS